MKLYEFAPTRSIRARWALQALGLKFESQIVNLGAGEHRSPEFLALNPAGKLPVLVDGDLVLTESVAIVIHLAETHPESGLLPSAPALRAKAFQWMLFAMTELEQPLWRISRHGFLYAESERIPEEIPIARRDFREMVAVLEAHLSGRQHLVGERFSAADIIMAYTLDWANEIELLDESPCCSAYLERQYERPDAPQRVAAALASVRRA